MDTGADRRIEIFAPCSAALELTKRILFQPFDFAKWLVIGFAAFLSHLGGGGGRFNYNPKFGRPEWNFRSVTHDAFGSTSGMPGWVIPLVGFGLVIGFIILVVLWWIGARGKFIFTDCIVRNRGAIVEPWHEFNRQANSLFLFLLVSGVLVLCLMSIAALPLLLPYALRGNAPEGIGLVFGITLLAFVAILTAVSLMLIVGFMVPVMYRRRCGALEAFTAVLGLITEHPGPIILYLLFIVVLGLAFGMISCLIACLTCCLTAIPYVGTVILLPAYVFLTGYTLLFIRQFGPDYDAWANILPIAPPTPVVTVAPPIDPPPMQS